MSPIALFDKSFLQSLTLDEAVLFDNFFLCNVPPVFYVETLADLEKPVRADRTPEREVRIIADKTPQLHADPNVLHSTLGEGDLLGHPVPMDGRIVLAGGSPVRDGTRTGLVFKPSPEAEAFSRWQRGEFLNVERMYAKVWREAMSSLNFDDVLRQLNGLGITPKTCQTLEQARDIARSLVRDKGSHFERMKLAVSLLGVPRNLLEQVFERWKNAGYPPLANFAPYAAYVVTIDIFFYIAAAAQLFSTKKVTNRVDLAYLYYLPFCMVFVSSDHFHRRCAPLFLRDDQQFVWGPDLKGALASLDRHYSSLPEEELAKGLFALAARPPAGHCSVVTELWDRFCPSWKKQPEVTLPLDPEANRRLVEHIKKLADAPRLKPHEVDFDTNAVEGMSFEKRIPRKRGKYWQVPRDLDVDEKS